MDEKDNGSVRHSKQDTAAPDTVGGRPADAASPTRRGSTNRDSGIVPQEDPALEPMDEKDNGSLRHSKQDTAAPNAIGGRPADASSPTRRGSITRDNGTVPQEDPAHFVMDKKDKDALINTQHDTPAPADASPTTFFSLEELKSGVEGIPYDLREQHLHPDEFEKLFGMTRENFNEMRQWKRVDAKKKAGLF
jgi:hypothetical protein